MKKLLVLVALTVVAAETCSETYPGPTCDKQIPLCKPSPYRTYDGSCNNLKHPLWATPYSVYERFLVNSYSDGSDAFPTSSTKEPLMNPRDISLRVFPDIIVKDPRWNVITVHWGQIVAHDMSLTAAVPQTGVDDISCCTDGEPIPASPSNIRCAAIPIPDTDPYNAPEGRTCINFVRTLSTKYLNCSASGNVDQFSSVTGYYDLSLVYGNSEKQARSLRAFENGKLAYVLRKGEPWLPQDPNATLACIGLTSETEPCYHAGDVRVNQNPQLAMLQNILMRAHNAISEKLCKIINIHWNDERCYQEARKILIAISQHITYNEFLPFVLGTENLKKKFGNYLDTEGFFDDYDENVNAQTLNEHASAAYRLYHSEVVGHFKKYSARRGITGSIRLSDWYNRPSVIEKGRNFCELSRGLTIQRQNAVDRSFDNEISNYFFRAGNKLGDDLHAIDIQRARDHGLGTYASTLRACKLSDPKDFSDLTKYIQPNYVKLLQKVYKNVEDVELVVAIPLETLVNGTLAGPTSLCIMLEQFWRTRVGDRYFYAHGKTAGAFTLKQLKSIQKGATMAKFLCDNVKCIRQMQPRAFDKKSKTNPLKNCIELPQVDLWLWKEETTINNNNKNKQ